MQSKKFICRILLFFILFRTSAFPLMSQQTASVSGMVTDSSGETLPGVSVSVKGENIGTITGVDGKFTLNIPRNKAILIFSCMGYQTQEVSFAGKSYLAITLSEHEIGLEEVVVVGYGVQKKETVTGAISSVKTRELLQSSQANISNALVGRLSGLAAVQKSGEPGKDQATIRVRGIGSFASNGGGVDLQAPLIMVDGIETPNYNSIDPNEIENVTVLKDASATAVYGVRGANGVILITTKRGIAEKPKVSASANYAIQNFANLRKAMSSYDWARSFNEAVSYDGYITGNYIPKFTDEELVKYRDHTDPVFYPDTDWNKVMFKNYTHQSQYNVNITGGTEKVKYFVSLGYFNQNGMYNNTGLLEGYDTQVDYNRYNFRANFDFQVTKDFSLVFNISDQLQDRKAPAADSEYIIANAFSHPPTSGPGVIDGKIINNLPGRFNFTDNPLYGLVVGSGHLNEYKNQLNGSVRADYQLRTITQGLSAHVMVSYQNYNMHTIRYTKSMVTYDAQESAAGPVFIPRGADGAFGVNDYFGKNRKVYMEGGFDYLRKFRQHTIGGLLLYNQSKYFDPGLAYLIPNGYQGIVGRITYRYADKYLAEFNAGWNGTENFAPDKRFGFFPAYSLGWILSNEKFFPENGLVSFLKIRGSYGQVGNDKIGGERFLYRPTAYLFHSGDDVYGVQNSYNFGTVGLNYTNYTTSSEGKIGNPDLTWERAEKMNIGADANFWKDKIRLTFDLFRELRKNILTTKNTTPIIVGADMPAYNMGEMKNSGWDGEINFRDKIKDFNYWFKGIYTYAHNEILYMDEVNPSEPYLRKTGQRFNQYFGFIADGFYNTWEEVNDPNRPVSTFQNNRIQPGDVKYKDVNGDGYINSFDMVPIGYSDFPEITYGFSFGGDYRGFDFSVLFQGSERVSFRASKKSNRGFQEDGSAVDYLKDYSWTPERYANGETILFPHLSSNAAQQHNYQPSTLWIRDASYIRLKNTEIGYSFTGKSIKKMGLSSLRIYANGTNLHTWHHLFPGEDPEIPTYNDGNYEPYPIIRTINFGLNLTF
jgi:TonB-linked SusC/RagA family outer membrane protein